MAAVLIAGANTPVSGNALKVRASLANGGAVDFAVAVIPVPEGVPCWLPLQEPPPSYAEGAQNGVDFTLQLDRFPENVTTVSLVAYCGGTNTTLKSLQHLTLNVDGNEINLDSAELSVPSIVFAELYRRNNQWKIRAKKDGVFDGIEELARRLGVQVVDRTRNDTSSRREHEEGPSAGRRSGGSRGNMPDWTGSGSLVADRFLVTNAHVVDNASEIYVSGFSGKSKATPVIVDDTNDLALLRLADSFGPSGIVFRDAGVQLGETAHSIGYPLAHLLGRGPQFTSGTVSNLLGPRDDARLMQVTCPIQPGSSGGPVFDEAGNLIAVVTATLNNTQNVNFAIRAALVLPLLDAANIDFRRSEKSQALQVSEIVRANSSLVWRVECFR